eukprot:COSAG05_NODE_355_length_10856_cov_7.197174_9_plen_87_part_00
MAGVLCGIAGGVTAPLVLIEDSDSEEHHMKLCRHALCHMGMQRATRSITRWSDKRYHLSLQSIWRTRSFLWHLRLTVIYHMFLVYF